MKKNEEYIVKTIDETNQGSAIAKLDGQVIFINKALNSETLKIKIIKVNKKFAIAKIEEIIEPNPNRVDPRCKKTACGGCQIQYMNYDYQLKTKCEQLSQRVARLYDKDCEIRPVLGMKDPWHYRNKAQFPVQVKNDKILIGFYRPHSNDIVECDHCFIQNEKINEIYRWIKQNITLDQAKCLRHIFIRYAKHTQQAQIVWIGTYHSCLDILSNQLVEAFSCIKSIVFNENQRNDNVILGENYKILYGNDFIVESCLGNQIKLHFKSFFQVNPDQMEVLYTEAIKAASLNDDMDVIELYSGTGTIGMAISQYVKTVTGVEIVEDAVKNAKENCKINHITNCHYVCLDATEFAHEYKKKTDVVFVDPPRKGMSQQGIHDIANLNPNKIIYISCNPETLLRDLNIFKEKGYRATYIQPVDMFCHTTSLECVACIEKIM